MKKLIILAIAALFAICSCSKDSTPSSLGGTNWTWSNEVLQFSKDGKVTITNTESNDTATGTYTYSDNKVTFKNLALKTEFTDFVYDRAEVNGKMMTVFYHYTLFGKTDEQSRIFEKK